MVYESKTVSLNLRTKITVEPCLVVCAADIKFEYNSEARHRVRLNEGSDGALGPQSLGCLGQGMCLCTGQVKKTRKNRSARAAVVGCQLVCQNSWEGIRYAKIGRVARGSSSTEFLRGEGTVRCGTDVKRKGRGSSEEVLQLYCGHATSPTLPPPKRSTNVSLCRQRQGPLHHGSCQRARSPVLEEPSETLQGARGGALAS